MDNRKIKAKDTPFRFWNGAQKKTVTFKCPCTQLEFKNGKYYCKVWDKERPDFCNTYPDNIFYDVERWNTQKIEKLLEDAKEDCPGLKDVTVEDVIKMLKEYRGD